MPPDVAALAASARVQYSRVGSVRSVLDGLEKICRPKAVVLDCANAVFSRNHVDLGKNRRFAWAEVGPDQASQFFHPVRGMVNFVFECAGGGFGGLFQTIPIHVELPTVITAFDSVLPYSAKIEGRAAVRAVKSQQPETTAAIAK